MAGKKKTAKTSARVRAAKPLTDRYLYVEARGWFHDADFSNNGEERVLDGPISFDSIIVSARTEDDAYNLGIAQLQQRQDETEPRGEDGEFTPGTHATGDFLNDYVVKL